MYLSRSKSRPLIRLQSQASAAEDGKGLTEAKFVRYAGWHAQSLSKDVSRFAEDTGALLEFRPHWKKDAAVVDAIVSLAVAHPGVPEAQNLMAGTLCGDSPAQRQGFLTVLTRHPSARTLSPEGEDFARTISRIIKSRPDVKIDAKAVDAIVAYGIGNPGLAQAQAILFSTLNGIAPLQRQAFLKVLSTHPVAFPHAKRPPGDIVIFAKEVSQVLDANPSFRVDTAISKALMALGNLHAGNKSIRQLVPATDRHSTMARTAIGPRQAPTKSELAAD